VAKALSSNLGNCMMSMPLGSYFLDRDQPPLSSEEAEVVRQFQDLSFRHWLERGADTFQLSWFGYQLIKCPLDLWVYQELLVRTRPDFVVETGTGAVAVLCISR
jgi:cephalosporin hydroxylase